MLPLPHRIGRHQAKNNAARGDLKSAEKLAT